VNPLIWLAQALCLLIVLASNSNAHAKDTTKELNSIQSNLKSEENNLSTLKKKRSNLEKKLEQNNKLIKILHEKTKANEETLNIQQKSIKQIRTKKNTLLLNQKSLIENISPALNSLYLLRNKSWIKVFLNQDNIVLSNRLLTYHKYFSKKHFVTIENYKNNLQELTNIETDLVTKETQLIQNKKKLMKNKTQLTIQETKQKTILLEFKSEEKKSGLKLLKLIAQQKELEKIFNNTIKKTTKLPTSNKNKAFKLKKGKLHWPVKGKILHEFGASRSNSQAVWNGLFIQTNPGVIIKTPAPGKVVFSDWLKGFGLLLIINHGDGYMTLYAHNQTLLQSENEYVSEGQDIAQTGNSGSIENTGLYFEIRRNGKPINPKYWMIRQ